MDRPRRIDRVEPSRIVQARTSSGPAVRNKIRPSRRELSAITRSSPDSAIPSSSLNTAASSGSSSPSSISIRADKGVDQRVSRGHTPAASARDPRPAPGDVALADVQQDEDRLLGSGTGTRGSPSPRRLQADVADGDPAWSPHPAGRTASSRSFDSRSAGVPWRPTSSAARAPLDEGEVGEEELGVEPVEVAGRVDPPRGADYGVLEGPDDVEERFRVA